MDERWIATFQCRHRSLALTRAAKENQKECGLRKASILLVIFAATFASLASPRTAAAWRHVWGYGPSVYNPYGWAPAPGPFPGGGPLPGTRFSIPPGASLSYYDPGSGTTYCWSQSMGFYFPCGYSASAPYAVGPPPPIPPAVPPPPGDQAAPYASGLLLFKLPTDAEAVVDGVPVGLSDGLGIHAVTPGRHRVVLRMSGKENEHTVTVTPHRIFTVTPTTILPTEP
jgi:hypothetical protein